MQYSSQFKNIHTTQISHTFTPYQLLCIYDYKSGIYQGEYYKNHRQGKGVFYWYSGQIYIGEWLNDSIQGQGTLYFPYGGNFVGFFHNNKAEGAGILTLLDGSRIAGFWKQGRIEGNFVRYDSELDEWILLNSRNYYNINKQSSNYSYAVSHQQIQNAQYQKQVNQIYESVKQKIDTPYYKQMTERLEGHNLQTSASFSQFNFQQNQNINQTQNQNTNFFNQVCLTEVDKFKIKLQQLDNEIFYHGIVRGSRPDGMGIMFSMNGRFSVRGKFANTKLNGPGRVELENGEIYDGIFRNGIISSGFYYNAKFNSYISGTFRGEGDVKLDMKGKGYPYKLTLENKTKAYPYMMIYKNTSEELIFLVQNDIKLLKMLDISKYILSAHDNSIQNTDQKINSANTFGFENTVEESQDDYFGPQTKQDDIEESNQNILIQFNKKRKNNQSLHQNFDDAFEEFLVGQQLDPAQSRQISQEYYSRQFEKEQENERILQLEENKQINNRQKVETNTSNFSSSQHDKEYFKKILLHKINVEGIKELGYEDLQRFNQISEDIDKENLSMLKDFKEQKGSSQTIEQNAEYFLNKARFLKLKLKLKEETQNQFDENKSQRQNSFSHISSQQAAYVNNYKKGRGADEDEIGQSPEFFQTNDNEGIRKYSVAVPVHGKPYQQNNIDYQHNGNNKSKNQGYQMKGDNYLNVSSEFPNSQNNQSRNSLLQVQNDMLNQRKNSFKKSYKDIQINIQNASFENSPSQLNTHQNDQNSSFSRDQMGYQDEDEQNLDNYYDQNKY